MFWFSKGGKIPFRVEYLLWILDPSRQRNPSGAYYIHIYRSSTLEEPPQLTWRGKLVSRNWDMFTSCLLRSLACVFMIWCIHTYIHYHYVLTGLSNSSPAHTKLHMLTYVVLKWNTAHIQHVSFRKWWRWQSRRWKQPWRHGRWCARPPSANVLWNMSERGYTPEIARHR